MILGALLAEAPKGPPQLHCVLIRYTGEPRLSFLFDISQVGNELRFDQLYLVEISGLDKTVMQPPFPEWRFDASAEPARLESEISVFDNSAAGHMEKKHPLSEPVRAMPAVATGPSGLRRAIDARSLLLRDGAIRALDESQFCGRQETLLKRRRPLWVIGRSSAELCGTRRPI